MIRPGKLAKNDSRREARPSKLPSLSEDGELSNAVRTSPQQPPEKKFDFFMVSRLRERRNLKSGVTDVLKEERLIHITSSVR